LKLELTYPVVQKVSIDELLIAITVKHYRICLLPTAKKTMPNMRKMMPKMHMTTEYYSEG
jgi:hypothetical protein